MSNLTIEISSSIIEAYKQLIATPYYKEDETTYTFAAHIIDGTENANGKTYLQHISTESQFSSVLPIFQKAIRLLSAHTILASDLLTWTTYHKAKGTVSAYQNILASTYHELLIQSINDMIRDNSETADDSDNDEATDDFLDELYGYPIPFDTETTNKLNDIEYVLNHNNPFADISIQNQQFIYASDVDQFGTLSLNTSHTVTRIQHDEDKSYLVMQPGFKIKTTNAIQMVSPQEVIFDDELTSELAQQDDKIYVYIN